MAQVQKSPEGLFIPRELIADFEHVEVDSAIAHQLLERYLQGVDGPIAPDLLIAECGNILFGGVGGVDFAPCHKIFPHQMRTGKEAV
jgi:hypothetical protein